MSNEPLQDGLYRATRFGSTAGFIVKHGIVISCAPILRRHIANQVYNQRTELRLRQFGYTVTRIGSDPCEKTP
jgi:hypothetical protein